MLVIYTSIDLCRGVEILVKFLFSPIPHGISRQGKTIADTVTTTAVTVAETMVMTGADHHHATIGNFKISTVSSLL